MAKVYKDTKSKMIIIEGSGDFIPGMLSFSISSNIVSIFDKATRKTIFDDDWNNISTETGDVFQDEGSLIQYLNSIFEDVILLQVDTNEIQQITLNEAQTDYLNS